MRLRCLIWTGGTILATCAVIGFFILLNSSKNRSDAVEEKILAPGIPLEEKGSPSAYQHSIDPIDEAAATLERLVDISAACPDPAAVILSDACLQAIELFFSNWSFGTQFSTVKPYTTGLKYSRIFNDPGRDRRLVFATLERKECFLSRSEQRSYWGQNFADISEHCHAAAFTNYAQFNAICSEFRDSRDAEKDWIDPERSTYQGKTRFQHFLDVVTQSDGIQDNDAQFERRKRWLWREVLEVRWLKQKCAQFNMVPTMDAVRDLKNYEKLRTHGERIYATFASHWEFVGPSSNIYEALTKLADYLGDGDTREGYRRGGEAWEELVYGRNFQRNLEANPWRKELDQGKLGPSHGRGDRLFVALDAVLALELERIEFDWPWLVESVCKESDYIGTDEIGNMSCQEVVQHFRVAFAEILEDSRKTGDNEEYTRAVNFFERRHQFFNKFEDTAVELGLYD
ncbi:MAG: hypothetical protein OXG24_11640 [Gammaproteobacteria bacterium]|nr:hypothetical protein [Gammaproteobacteria bacterium]